VVEGKTFTARGHRVTYSEAKDLLVLEGDGRTDAQLFQQARPGASTSQTAARKIMFWPKTRRVQIDDIRFIDPGGALPVRPSGTRPR
jgi:hypothetical protein